MPCAYFFMSIKLIKNFFALFFRRSLSFHYICMAMAGFFDKGWKTTHDGCGYYKSSEING